MSNILEDKIQQELDKNLEAMQKASLLKGPLANAASLLIDVLVRGNKILICGNGGSAADSQHFAAELTGRYKRERRGLPAIALSTDTSALTAIGNDYGFKYVFARQVEALAKEGDLLFCISTSGNSENILEALKVAKALYCPSIGLSGKDGGFMSEYCNINLIAPSSDTPRIQELHILYIHILCELIEEHFANCGCNK
ncbi:D-sedoheptulose 7-phosphate isomerase [Helicobacter sp. 11S02629-2]|uniref:D-sedoheptulose 7-phosphate isomerase n=1 Tax=Helicobacter sp. 11S02629-2 TaxID=1476195 RepID=UPI000BA60079|nr:D-sedoheptulose 7-phosphate isomerase [Helicobacter sp. 11S02629-2]PAF45418.1 phosphoheptose isomerase [Helicobacter sp. 11S02629-2]